MGMGPEGMRAARNFLGSGQRQQESQVRVRALSCAQDSGSANSRSDSSSVGGGAEAADPSSGLRPAGLDLRGWWWA